MTATAFEDSGYTAWTSLDDETAFLEALETTDRVSVTVMGMSTARSNPVRLVTVDLPETPTDAPSVLFLGLQHGNEPASREALLSTIRDLAESTDPAILEVLGRVRFHFMPTCNPSSHPDVRAVYGSGGIDMNRSHVTLATVENTYVQRAITITDPVAVIDCHEIPTRQGVPVEILAVKNPMGDAAMQARADDIIVRLEQALDHEGIDHIPYGADTTNPRVGTAMSSLRLRASVLIETNASNPMIDRHTWHTLLQGAVIEWASDHAGEAADDLAAAKGRAAASTVPFDLVNGTIIDPRPEAYIFEAPAPHHLEAFGVQYTEDNGLVNVPMRQPASTVIPHLLDPEADTPARTATRVYPEAPPAPLMPPMHLADATTIRYRVGADTFEAEEVKLRLDGRVQTIWP